jgi:hypothetical protein
LNSYLSISVSGSRCTISNCTTNKGHCAFNLVVVLLRFYFYIDVFFVSEAIIFLYWLSIMTDAMLSCIDCLLWLMLCFPALTVYYDWCYAFLHWLSIMTDAMLSCIDCLLWPLLYVPVLTVYYDWCYTFLYWLSIMTDATLSCIDSLL